MAIETIPDTTDQSPSAARLGSALFELSERYDESFARLVKERDGLLEENKELFRLAYTDELTGLANRRGFIRQATETLEALSDDTPVAILYFDLRYFKQINDYPGWGHAVGDDVLRIASEVLQSLVRHESINPDGSKRPPDAIGRIGGDEFAVMLPLTGEGVIEIEAIRALVEQIVATKVKEALDRTRDIIARSSQERQEYPGIARLDSSGHDLLQRSIGMNAGVTIGLASELREPGTFEQKLAEADDDMYDQKRKPGYPSATLAA